MRNYKIIMIVLLIVVFNSNNIWADTDNKSPLLLGMAVGYNWNNSPSDFSHIEGYPNCCPQFHDGTGGGIEFSTYAIYKFKPFWGLGLKLSYNNTSIDYKANNQIKPVLVNNILTNAEIAHKMKFTFNSLLINPTISIFATKNLVASVGYVASFNTNTKFKQGEVLIKPEHSGFSDTKSNYRNVYSENITDFRKLTSLVNFDLMYLLPINRNNTLFIYPEIKYSYGLNQDIVKDKDIKDNSFYCGVGVAFNMEKKQEIMNKQIFQRDTVRVFSNQFSTFPKVIPGLENRTYENKMINDVLVKYEIINVTDTLMIPKTNADFNFAIIDTNNNKIRTNSLHLKYNLEEDYYNMLPVVFFDFNSSELSDMYYKNPKNFNIDYVQKNPVEIQKNILLILAYRLNNTYKNAKLYITGYVDKKTEKNDCILAKNRAESIKNFLVNTLGINSERIVINSSRNCIPVAFTKSQTDEAFAENRRVELSSDEENLFEPLQRASLRLRNDNEYKSISLITNVKKNYTKSYNVLMSQEKTILSSYKEINDLSEVRLAILPQDTSKFINGKLDAVVSAIALDSGASDIQSKSMMLTKDTIANLKRLYITHFEVGSGEMTKTAKILLDKVLSHSELGSKVTIKSYTDKLGDDNMNIKLSEKRAASVKEYISKNFPQIQITNIESNYSTKYPLGINSYDTPIDRFLSRTVVIEVVHVK